MNGIGRGSDDKEKKKEKTSILTRETVGVTLLLFSALILLIAATGPYIFGDVGRAITAFFVGVGGYFIYPLLIFAIYGFIVLIAGKPLLKVSLVVRAFLLVFAVFLIVHTATAEKYFIDPATSDTVGYGTYLAGCFSGAGESLGNGTGGGFIFALFCYPLRFLFQLAGTYVVFSLLLLLALWFFLIGTPLRKYLIPDPRHKKREKRGEGMGFGDLPDPVTPPIEEQRESREERGERPAEPRPYSPYPYPPYPPYPYPYPPYPPQTESGSRDGARMSVRQDEAYTRSRDILFSDDAAANYRENLIYSADSRFNSQPRRSTMERRDPSSESYGDRYARQTEEGRPAMPRRVTEERPRPEEGGYSYPLTEDYDVNYPRTPSYRAPIPPAPSGNFYENDVEPARDDGQSAETARPARFDEPRREQPHESEPTRRMPVEEEPIRRMPVDEEPVRRMPTEEEPTRRMPVDEEPVRRMPTEGEPTRRTPETPSTPESPRYPLGGREREASFRSLFEAQGDDESYGDPVRGLRDPAPETPSETFGRGLRDPAPETPSETFGRGLRDPAPETPSETFGRGLRDPAPETGEDVPGPSRIYDTDMRSASELFDGDDPISDSAPETSAPEPSPRTPTPPAPKPKKKHVWKRYKRPDVSLLDDYPSKPELSREETGRNSGIILDTLKRYGLETEVTNVVGGAAVTRYDLAMPPRATINMVTKYSGEIAMYLKVKNVNMYANTEVGGISVEVPNAKRVTVGLKSVLVSDNFNKDEPDALTFALGQDLEGRSVCGNITDMTHILVAGTTGSGKSITMHAMLISLLYKYSPEDLRLILIDPKQSEFTIYEGLPHLMINEIITEPSKVVTALNWAIKEMERRYSLFNERTRSGIAVRKLDEYNATLGEGEEKLPKILIVVDEFGDLMLVVKKDLEERIQRLTQKARAAGIHIVLATQRPSADVVTGVIKGNLPTRIALSVDSELNSRIILDETGAETLLGKGDMFVKAGGKMKRVQGVYIGTAETQRVVNFIRENNESYYDEEVSDFIDQSEEPQESGGSGGDEEVSDTYIRALAIVIKRGQASISLIQRSCSVGYNHAGKIIEWMEAQSYISKFDGAKARTVLITKEEFESKYGSLD